MTTATDIADELRAWARGMTTLEAATELLIRDNWVGPNSVFVRRGDDDHAWIDYVNLTNEIGALSGGQQRYLRIAASIGADEPGVLGDELARLDRAHADLVLAAVAHAAGFTSSTSSIERGEEGTVRIVPAPNTKHRTGYLLRSSFAVCSRIWSCVWLVGWIIRGRFWSFRSGSRRMMRA